MGLGKSKNVQETKPQGIKEVNNGEVSAPKNWLEQMKERRVIQFVDQRTGLVIVPQEDKTGGVLMYSGKVMKSDIRSFFEIVEHGCIRHVDTGFLLGGESSEVRFGLAIALKATDPDPKYAFDFDANGYWRHPKTTGLMQPAGNKVYEGARLLVNEDFTKSGADNASTDARFTQLQVPVSVLEWEWRKKQLRDDQRAFENSSDGRIAKMRAMGILEDNDGDGALSVMEANPCKVEVGHLNKLRIATNGNPVQNLSVRNTLSLTKLADITEMWSMIAVSDVPGVVLNVPVDKGEVWGGAVQLKSKETGFTLAMNDQGQLCHSDTTHNIWQVLDAGDSRVFILNLDLRCALASNGGIVQVLSIESTRVEDMRWYITTY